MGWVVVVGVVIVGLGVSRAFRRRHQTDVLATLVKLSGQQLDLAIAPISSKRSAIGEYTGVIESIDSTTRWVTFEWITRMDGGQIGSLSPEDLANGVIVDCIQWVRPRGHPLIVLA
jgi:hypothetical protein